MKATASALFVALFFVSRCAHAGLNRNDLDAQWQDANSQEFRSAVRYAIAQSLYSTFEANCWSPLCGTAAFELTKEIHKRLGKSVKMDVLERKGDTGSVEIYVFFPDLRLPTGLLFLRFSKIDGNYLFLEQGFANEFLRCNFAERGLETILPKDYAAVIKAQFAPKDSDIARLRQWCQEILKEDYPSDARKSNHFFVAPFSSRYDSYQASIFWVEGKKVLRIEKVASPTAQSITWNEMEDYDQPIQGKAIGDYASSYEWKNFVISRHVSDGLMLTLDGAANRSSAN